MPYVFRWPQFLRDYTNLTCFQTASHPGRKMFGFIFHLKYIILMFSFQINIYLQDMWVFSLILFSVSRELWTQSYWKWQCKTKTTRTMSPVALQRYQIIPSSLLFLPFVYHCFLFWHNMWDVQTLKAAPRSFVWGTHITTQHHSHVWSECLKMYEPCALCIIMF